MTTDRPEVDDPRVLALAKARQQMAHDNPFNAGFCPPWESLSEQEQRLDLLDARNYLRAALKAGLFVSSAVSVVPPATNHAGLLRWAADRLDADMERFFTEWPDEPRNSPYALGRKDAATELRRLAAEAPHAETPDEAVVETHVRYQVQLRHQGDADWKTSHPRVDFEDRERAEASAALSRELFPHREYRVVTRTTTITEAPAVVAQPGKETSSCGECSHPKDVHQDGDDPVSPGTCSACEADDPDEALHDYRAVAAS